jgi:hypothetical protein
MAVDLCAPRCANGQVHGSTVISTASSAAISIASGNFIFNGSLDRCARIFPDPFSATGAIRKISAQTGLPGATPWPKMHRTRPKLPRAPPVDLSHGFVDAAGHDRAACYIIDTELMMSVR